MKENIVGIDIGGTSIKIAIMDKNADILYKWRIPTKTSDHGSRILDDIWHSVNEKLYTLKIGINDILGIGVGAPGLVDSQLGVVYEAVNIGWKDFNLADELHKRSQLPVLLENDANLAALGENWKGSGGQARNMIAVTLGTGVGCGVIANGMILHGANGTAGEIGHVTLDRQGYTCNCGLVGCLDTIASATGIVHQSLDLIHAQPQSSLAVYYNNKGSIEAKDVFLLAKNGDILADRVIEHTSEILGRSLAFAATIINPSKIILGGGVSKAGTTLLHRVSNYFHEYTLTRISEACSIQIAQLGDDAGIIGAAYLVEEHVDGCLV